MLDFVLRTPLRKNVRRNKTLEKGSDLEWSYGTTIKTDLKDIGQGGTEWIALAQDTVSWRALVNAGMNFRVP